MPGVVEGGWGWESDACAWIAASSPTTCESGYKLLMHSLHQVPPHLKRESHGHYSLTHESNGEVYVTLKSWFLMIPVSQFPPINTEQKQAHTVLENIFSFKWHQHLWIHREPQELGHAKYSRVYTGPSHVEDPEKTPKGVSFGEHSCWLTLSLS